ncbi:MAG: protein kinase, partial [Vicinamibacteria bacterium]
MSPAHGSRIGPYEIIAAIGAGGMGEVFRARDTKLNRDVAIKVLPSAFADDPERLARFKREAQVLASLNHPNIAAIHGLEDADPPAGSGQAAIVALVMELVEGEDLSAHIGRGPIPVAEALPIARQIAEALEAAHEQGIVHRDLKPANIKVRTDGTVKVLDFGLAKAMDPSGASNPNVSHSPTLTHQGTQAGMIIGTAAYMSPEQAKGKPVDKRADIWAFGVVLYEMLTGRRAFKGEDVSETLASVLKDTLSMDALPTHTPPRLKRLIERCLERDLKNRLRDIGEARFEISKIESGAPDTSTASAISSAPGAPASTMSRMLPWAIVGALAIALVTALALRSPWTIAPVDAPTARFSMVDGARLKVATWTTTPFGASRDGKTIIFNADDGSGGHLWVRTLDQPEPRALPDTDGAYQPAISPDGEWVAFVVANHVIRKSRLSGGGATTVTTTDDLTAALAWTSNDEIVFEKIGSDSGIHRVSANGGPAKLLIPIDKAAGEAGQRRPLVLLDERLIIYASSPADGATHLAAFSLADGRRRHLDVESNQALGMVDGQLLYVRREGGVLMAVPFDVSGLRVLGTPRQLSDRVAVNSTGTAVSLSPAGTLVYALSVSPLSRLMLGDMAGHATSLTDAAKGYRSARFSPDSRRIATGIEEGDNRNLWILDRGSKEATRLTRGGNNTLSLEGWMPDGKALLFTRDAQLWIVPVDGGAEPRRLFETAGLIQGASPAPDGRTLLVSRRVRNHDGL